MFMVKDSARNLSNFQNNSELMTNNPALFLSTKELISRGSTENGKIVTQINQFRKNTKKLIFGFGKTKNRDSINLINVAKQLHKSMDDHIIGKISENDFQNQDSPTYDNSGSTAEAKKLLDDYKLYSSQNKSKLKLDRSVNLLKLVNQKSGKVFNHNRSTDDCKFPKPYFLKERKICNITPSK